MARENETTDGEDREPRALIDSATAAVIDAYRNRRPGLPAEKAAADEFAKGLVRIIGAPDAARAHNLLGTLSELALWCQAVGIPLDHAHALKESTIQRFVSQGIARGSDGKRRSARTNLFFVGRKVVPTLVPPKGELLPRSRPAEPYSPSQISEYLRLAAAQPTENLRDRLTALICASRGGGIEPAGLRSLRGVDVRRHGGAVICDVNGPRARSVPIDGRFGRLLFTIARRRRSECLIGGDAASRKNFTGNLVHGLHGGAHLPRLNVSRLQATWRAEKLSRIKFKEFCQAAGIKQSAQLFELLPYLPQPTLDEVIKTVWTP